MLSVGDKASCRVCISVPEPESIRCQVCGVPRGPVIFKTRGPYHIQRAQLSEVHSMTKYRIWLTWFLARLVAELMERTGRYLKSPLLHKYSMRRSILLAYLGQRGPVINLNEARDNSASLKLIRNSTENYTNLLGPRDDESSTSKAGANRRAGRRCQEVCWGTCERTEDYAE